MKKIINTTTPNNIVSIKDFDPINHLASDLNIKPIGLQSRNDGDKAFIQMDEYCGNTFSVISVNKFENGNSYARKQKVTELRDFIEKKMGAFDFYVFENSKELLRWLSE
jgi:hypothetical protein